jgi:hypothetical protein
MDLSNTSPIPQRNRNRDFSKIFKKPYIIPAIVVGLFIFGVIILATRSASTAQPVLGNAGDQRVAIAPAKKIQNLNKGFSFPLRDATGKEVSKVRYELINAELRDEIIVKGQRAKSVKDRTFLVVNVKITNNFDKAIEITSRDYVRLITNNSSEKVAADIHNDPIEVQPISTKTTRLAFPIDDKKQNLKLQIGEINGSKETIDLTLYQ